MNRARVRSFRIPLAAALLAPALLAANRPALAVMPPRPDLGGQARRALASLAAKGAAELRPAAASFRPLDPEETRTLRALVLLVDFADNAATRPASDFSDLLFSSGTRAGGSLRDYYAENSRGRLVVTGTVIGWLRAPQTYAYYVNGQAGFGSYPRNARRLAEDAVTMARSRVRFSDFDNDGPDGVPHSGDDDGLVDALVIVHAGLGAEEAETPAAHVWSHSSSTPQEIPDDGASAFFYATTPEIGELGVQCHEFGHLLGLPDLYDTTPPRDPDSYGLGYWSLMAIGAWAGPPAQPGARPVHLDAWCKVRLGFVPPTAPASNLPGVAIGPVAVGGGIYRLWKNGDAGPNYFLVENRQRLPETFDRYLPGSGLLIYRVDETAGDNDDAERYRVGLVQADGRRDLEEERNAGDEGDPFPGSTGAQTFMPGDADEVGVAAIQDLSPEAIRADLTVETRPSLRLVSLRASASDPWPWPRWGETAPLAATVANVGRAAGEVTASLALDDPRVHVDGPLALGPLAEDATATAVFTLAAEADDPLATAGIEGRLVLAHDGVADTVAVLLTVGRGFGYATGFETSADSAAWRHGPVVPGRGDYWSLTTARAHGGARAYRFTGPRGTYEIDSDGALVSPPILLGVESRLTFWHWMAAEVENSVYAFDGGRVETSVEGGAWTTIEPEDGYPYRIDPFTTTMLDRQRVYSGAAAGWRLASFDLGDVTGSARFRFRFVADQSVNLEGWYVDDVTVTTRALPFRVVLETPAEEGDRIRVGWRVEEAVGPYDGAGFRLYRTTEWTPGRDPSDGYALIAEVAADSAGVFAHEDGPLPRGKLYSYLLEEQDEGGAPRALYGPASVFLAPPAGGVQFLDPFPNPLRGSRVPMTIRYIVPGDGEDAGGAALLALFDVRGRRIRVLDERPAAPGLVTVVWDGTASDGRRAASGVYVLRVESPAGSASRRVVVVR